MFAILVDKEGYELDFDMLEVLEQKELQEDEQIIEKDWEIANSMNKPKWDFDKLKWVDTEPLPPVEIPTPQPTEVELLKQDLEQANKRSVLQDVIMAELALQVAKNTLLK